LGRPGGGPGGARREPVGVLGAEPGGGARSDLNWLGLFTWGGELLRSIDVDALGGGVELAGGVDLGGGGAIPAGDAVCGLEGGGGGAGLEGSSAPTLASISLINFS
jgi:hypothetical protein